MTPDDQARRIDGLLTSYGQIQRDLGELEARSDALEKAMASAAVEFARILAAVDKSCGDTATRLEVAIAKQGEHFEAELLKITAARQAARWTRGQMLTLIGIVFAPTVGILLLLFGIGGGSG